MKKGLQFGAAIYQSCLFHIPGNFQKEPSHQPDSKGQVESSISHNQCAQGTYQPKSTKEYVKRQHHPHNRSHTCANHPEGNVILATNFSSGKSIPGQTTQNHGNGRGGKGYNHTVYYVGRKSFGGKKVAEVKQIWFENPGGGKSKHRNINFKG
ncbi:hypothetical protein ES703_106494 [subsurface metagenome]